MKGLVVVTVAAAERSALIEKVAKDLCDARNETDQNYHRASLGWLVAGWPKPRAAA